MPFVPLGPHLKVAQWPQSLCARATRPQPLFPPASNQPKRLAPAKAKPIQASNSAPDRSALETTLPKRPSDQCPKSPLRRHPLRAPTLPRQRCLQPPPHPPGCQCQTMPREPQVQPQFLPQRQKQGLPQMPWPLLRKWDQWPPAHRQLHPSMDQPLPHAQRRSQKIRQRFH